MATPHILIVEDEVMISEYLGKILADSGYHVTLAANADEAMPILESRDDIRVLITDIDMPGTMGGLRLAAFVRDRWPPIKIIIATGKGKPKASNCRETRVSGQILPFEGPRRYRRAPGVAVLIWASPEMGYSGSGAPRDWAR